jgi:hypothetical protein
MSPRTKAKTNAVIRALPQIEAALTHAKAIAWDECHKIYVLMDDEQVAEMRGYGYDPLITKAEQNAEQMLETLTRWYAESCPFRFINSVSTDHDNPNAGFHGLIPQASDLDEDRF